MTENRQMTAKGDGSQAYVLQRIAAIAKQRLHKNAMGLMNETINPLWNIDERKAEMIYNWARSGNYAQVQYLYNDIENKDPTLGVCVTRRTSAVAELDWRVVRSDQRLNRTADQKLVDEQIACVEEAMAKIDNMPDALEHLALSAFRGFSAVTPVHGLNGDIQHLDCIDGWNLCYDRMGQSWLFNASATSFYLPTNYTMASSNDYREFNRLEKIPPEMLCVVTRKREIDWPAMQIFIRAAVGERDWGRFLETYGLPPVIITMPEFTSKEDQEAYVQAAESVFEGRSGVVPYGSNISFASESRGTNPFTEFIEHQQKLIVMMSTGGTLATLAESGTGTLAGDAQQDEWKRIIRADKRIISNAVNKQICEQILRENFKGQPILAEFQLDDTPKPTPKEMLELASLASSAGYEMDAEELSQAIGYKLTKKAEGVGMGFNAETPEPPTNTISLPDDTDPNAGEFEEPVATNAGEDEPFSDNIAENPSKTPSVEVLESISNNEPEKEETPPTPITASVSTVSDEADEIGQQLVASLQQDFKPVADRLVGVLALPEDDRPGAAVKLMQDLDSLVPDDPAMAEVIAAEMQKSFNKQVVAQPMGNAPAAKKAVPNSLGCEMPDESDDVYNTECHVNDHLCRIHDKSKIDALSKQTAEEATANGKQALIKMLYDHQPVTDAMWRQTTGVIDFEWGHEGTAAKNYSDGWGLAKVAKKHPEAVGKIADIVSRGAIYQDKGHAENKLAIIKGDSVVILYKDSNGCFIFNSFTPNAHRYIDNIKRNNPPLEAAR